MRTPRHTPQSSRWQKAPGPQKPEELQQEIRIEKLRGEIRRIPGTIEVMDAVVEYIRGKRGCSVEEEFKSMLDAAGATKVAFHEFRRWIRKNLDIGGYFTKKQIENVIFAIETNPVPQGSFVKHEFEAFVQNYVTSDSDPMTMAEAQLREVVSKKSRDAEFDDVVIGLCTSVKATIGVSGLLSKLRENGFKELVPRQKLLRILQEAGVSIREPEVISAISCMPLQRSCGQFMNCDSPMFCSCHLYWNVSITGEGPILRCKSFRCF
jgi:hypothetical protein